MVYSSVLVNVEGEKVVEVGNELREIEGVEVLESKNGRIAVVIESECTETLAATAELIRRLNFVSGVEIISHFFEEEAFNKKITE